MQKTGVYKFFGLLSSELRVKILEVLREKEELSYTELMQVIGFDPEKEAGRFAYHINSLVGSGLVVTDRKKYRLTDLGLYALDLKTRAERRITGEEQLYTQIV